MQVIGLNDFVPRAMPQENVSMPAEVKAALTDFWKRVGQKKKWAAYTAAILAFYRMSEEEQYRAMDAVEAARRRKNFGSLLIGDIGETAEEPTLPDREREQVGETGGRGRERARRNRGGKRPARTG